MDTKPFNIRLTKDVIFRDGNGRILNSFRTGKVMTAYCLVYNYYVTAIGEISFDEAELVK
jgi:hypothetical protein